MAIVELRNQHITLSVNSRGAEMASLGLSTPGQGDQELLWQGGGAWRRRAPVLFPIIGRMPGDEFTHRGVVYPITQHGFARDLEFGFDRISDIEVEFTLDDSLATRIHFPFSFRLEVRFELVDAAVRVTQTVSNPGYQSFAASLGAHPGFVWPLPGAAGRGQHVLEFELPEAAPIRRLEQGLLAVDSFPNPVIDRTLNLDELLFDADAVIFDQLSSRSVRYSAPGAPSITVEFPDFPILGLWSKAPGEFVCIEPWFGMTAASDFSGEYDGKPHQFILGSSESREFTYGIAIEHPAP